MENELEQEFQELWKRVKPLLPDHVSAAVLENLCAAIIVTYAPSRDDAAISVYHIAQAVAVQSFASDPVPKDLH
jgi:hypothetical protein